MINRMMLPQELRTLWTWNEKEDTTKHCEHYSTIKSRTAATQVRLERSLIWKRLRLKLFILLSVFSEAAINMVGQYPSPAISLRKETSVNMETSMEMEKNVNMQTNMDMEKIWSGIKLNELFHRQCITRFYSYSTRDIEQVYRYK